MPETPDPVRKAQTSTEMIADPGCFMWYIGPARMFAVPDPCRNVSRSRRPQVFLTWLGLLATVIVGTEALSAQTASVLRVVPLLRDDQVHVSFELRDGFTPEVRAAIQSGLETTFTYRIDLRTDAAGFFDRTISQAIVTNTVDYTTLTRKYQLERRVDGRLDRSHVTDDEAEVRQWLTSMDKLRLFPTTLLEHNREYYVRVTASARPSQGSMLWPFGSGTSGRAKFTFMR